MARVFISHSSANNAAATALRDWLSMQGCDDVFLDLDPQRGLVAGEKWQEALKAAADRCEAVIFLISPDWIKSKWCLGEFILAKLLLKRIFGVLIEPVPREQVPQEMAGEWQLCELAGEGPLRHFDVKLGGAVQTVAFLETGLVQLWRGLGRAGIDARVFPWPPPGEPNRAPYRGLRALEAEDAAIFFGRDAQIVRALDRIRSHVAGGDVKLMIVLGASGSGKSSFLRAGLWPRLAKDDATFLVLPVIRPEAAVVSGGSGLAAALSKTFGMLGAPLPPGRIKERLSKGIAEIGPMVDELMALSKARLILLDAKNSEPAIVISVDQAEELFNADGAAEAVIFFDLMAGLMAPGAETLSRRIIVLATIRSDRYELLQAEPRWSGLSRDLFDLPPISPSEYKGIIEGPARLASEAGGRLVVAEALTEQLIEDAKGADALPLLGFILERLFADYGGDGKLTLADYQTLGGLQGSLEAAVTRALADPGRAPAISHDGKAQQASLRDAFIPWLARINTETGAPMRRVARMSEIPETARNIVERLVAARLLVADRRAGVDLIEVAHESLLRQWPALANWLEAAASDLKTIDGVERSMTEWVRNDRQDAWLDHRLERLASANIMMQRADFRERLGDDGVAYLKACEAREASEREQKKAYLEIEEVRLAEIAVAQKRTARLQRSARWTLGALALVVVMGLSLIWLQQSRLDAQRIVIDNGRANLFAELSRVERLRENWDSAIRLAVQGARLGLHLDQQEVSASGGRMELAAAMAQSAWQLNFTRHEGWVTSAVFSPDGKQALTASADKTARIWDTLSGRELLVLRGHDAEVRSAAYNSDGSRIVTASSDRSARIWDRATGRQIAVLVGHGAEVMSAVFSPDDRHILTASFDHTARIWDAATGALVTTLSGHDDWLFSALYSPDGTQIVTSSQDRTARIWDAASGTELLVLRGHDAPLYDAAFSPSGAEVVTASGDNTARLWNLTTKREIAILRGHQEYVNSARFDSGGSKIVTASGDKTARLWDAATGKEIAVFRGHQDYLNQATFSSDGSRIVTAAKDSTARVWAIAQQRAVILSDHDGDVTFAAFSGDGKHLVTASADKTARIWDAATKTVSHILRGHEGALRSAVFSPDGAHVVTASRDRTARIWDVATGREIVTLRGHDNWVLFAAYSPDGSKIVTASWDKTIMLWEAATGKQIAILRGHTAPVWSATFSPDGTQILSASWDESARLWDVASAKQVLAVHGHEARLWNAAFSPDGSRFVTSAEDGTARVWNTVSGAGEAVLRGHEGTVFSAAFSPDGRRIGTASADKTARIWEASTGFQVAALSGHQDWVTSALYSTDGKLIITASRDGTARIWNARLPVISTVDMLRDACERKLGLLSVLNRDEMRLAGYPEGSPKVDVCADSR